MADSSNEQIKGNFERIHRFGLRTDCFLIHYFTTYLPGVISHIRVCVCACKQVLLKKPVSQYTGIGLFMALLQLKCIVWHTCYMYLSR